MHGIRESISRRKVLQTAVARILYAGNTLGQDHAITCFPPHFTSVLVFRPKKAIALLSGATPTSV
jgi:hypothetical protein